MNTMQPVKDFIIQNFLFGEESRVKEDTSFLSANIVDSTGMLELASFLEERYEISIGDEELIPENLDSLNNISSFLKRKLSVGRKDPDEKAHEPNVAQNSFVEPGSPTVPTA